MDKDTWYIHTMEYYSAIKNDKLFAFQISWRGLANIMLSDIKTGKREEYQMILLIYGT